MSMTKIGVSTMSCASKSLGVLLAVLAPLGALEPARASESCLDWRWIAVGSTSEVSCELPSASGWRGAPLFSPAALARSKALRRYCSFESVADSADPEILHAYTAGRFVRIDRDCAAAGGHSEPSPGDARWVALATELLRQSGAQAVPAAELLGPHHVRLAIVDTNPTNAIDPARDRGRSPHGNALVTIAETLACSAGKSCTVSVTSQLGLRFLEADPRRRDATHQDAVRGGLLGSIADLAVAIDAELADWRSRTPDHRLVLNLSLGWSMGFGGAENRVADMPVPVQAIYAVLQDASCQGVLVFAAAGNREAGVDEEIGALYPAAWESRPAPDSATCAQLMGVGGTADPNLFAAPYRPLVHAVGGIEADGGVLDNARPHSAPRLAAYADHAVVESLALGPPPSGRPTATLTGSSVATLLASINAAVAWTWQPSRGPHDIAALLHGAASGTASVLGRNVDVCLRDAAGRCVDGIVSVHRLDLCLTRKRAGPHIASLDCAWAPTDPRLGVDRAAFDATATVLDLGNYVSIGHDPACGTAEIYADASVPLRGSPCPHLELLGVASRPWVMPQPGSDTCQHCEDTDETSLQLASKQVVANQRVLRIEIAPQLSRPIDNLVLVAGSELYVLAPPHAVSGGSRFLIRGLGAHGLHGEAMEHAFLAFSIEGRYVAVSPLLHEN
jgi:hypothetical protein